MSEFRRYTCQHCGHPNLVDDDCVIVSEEQVADGWIDRQLSKNIEVSSTAFWLDDLPET